MKALNFKFLAAGSKGILAVKSVVVIAGVGAATYGIVKVQEINSKSEKRTEVQRETMISKNQFVNLSNAGFIIELDKFFSTQGSEEVPVSSLQSRIDVTSVSLKEADKRDITIASVVAPSLTLPVPMIQNEEKVGFDFTEDDISYFEKFGQSRTITPACFEGGNDKLSEFLSSSIVYPEEAIEQGIEGTVCVQFEVSPEGKIENVQTIKSVCESIDKEAERIVRLLPNWKPKQVNMENVPSIVQIPITFDIQ